MNRSTLLALGCSALMAAAARAQTPLGTAFTYQGRLTSGGVAQTASFDFQFALFDAATAGNQLGSTISQAAVSVSGGLFTANLDFGAQYISQRRWLEISVRPAGGGAYTTLTPRQELTATPQAAGLALPISGTVNSGSAALTLTNSGGDGVDVTGSSNGVSATATNPGGTGVLGVSNGNADSIGVWGKSSTGYGVAGFGPLYGGIFSSSVSTGSGLYAAHYAGQGSAPGAEADTYSLDNNAWGLVGVVISTTPGTGSAGLRGINNDMAGGATYGVWGSHAGYGWGVYGTANLTTGVGVGGVGLTGVFGYGNDTTGTGTFGRGLAGVYGQSYVQGGSGVEGEVPAGISTTNMAAIFGVDNGGIAGNYAGVFSGSVSIAGNVSKSGGSFKIDHPLDPANKYLYHSFVESPDMLNIYNGNASLDGSGTAVITMPDWFEALNTEFRYQLTAVGAPSPNLYIASEMHDRQFTIAGGTPGGRVSWLVTGIRQDPWANAHRIPIEETKRPEERGLFIHPELYGMPRSAAIDSLKRTPVHPAFPATAPVTPTSAPATNPPSVSERHSQ
jgi:hypothetical protein